MVGQGVRVEVVLRSDAARCECAAVVRAVRLDDLRATRWLVVCTWNVDALLVFVP